MVGKSVLLGDGFNKVNRLTVLGSGTCVPSATRYPPSYHVLSGVPLLQFNWLFDIGSGAIQHLDLVAQGPLGEMMSDNSDMSREETSALKGPPSFQNLDAVFISHVHPDHFAGLLPLLQALNFTPGYQRRKPFTIVGSQEVVDFVERNLDLYPDLRPKYPFSFAVLNDGDRFEGTSRIDHDAGWSVLSSRLQHSDSTHGLRLDIADSNDHHSLVYGADSEICSALVELAMDAELLILECSFPKDQPFPGHLTTTQAGIIAREARAQALLLSHLYPQVAQMPPEQLIQEVRESGYVGEILVAEDFLTIGF